MFWSGLAHHLFSAFEKLGPHVDLGRSQNHQACEFALRITLHNKFLWTLKEKDQLMSSIMMVQPLGVAVKMREILRCFLPEIC